MMKKELGKNWFIEMASGNADLAKIHPAGRKPPAPPPASTDEIPPFRGLSRKLLTRNEASARLSISLTTLDKLLRDRLIFAHPRGRLVYIPEEECENYVKRAMIERERRHA